MSLKNEQMSDSNHLDRPQAWAGGREITSRGETPHEGPVGSGGWSRHGRTLVGWPAMALSRAVM